MGKTEKNLRFVSLGKHMGIIYMNLCAITKKGGCVMLAEKPKKDKQLLAEQLWLLYFNDILYRDGIITPSDYRKMIHQINIRSNTVEQKKEN